MRSMVAIASLFVFGFCVQANADDTDAAATIQAMLTGYGPVPATRRIDINHEPIIRPRANCPGDSCDQVLVEGWIEHKPVTENRILTASNISIVKKGPFIFGEETRADFPQNFVAWYQQTINCDPKNSAAMSVSINKQTTHTESVTITKTITNTIGTTFTFSYNTTVYGNYQGSITLTRAEATATAHMDQNADATQRSGTGTTPVDPQTNEYAEFRVWPVRFSVPFTVNATVDADLSHNDKNFLRLSDIFDDTKRTFVVSGVMSTDMASEGVLKFFKTPVDPAECANTTGVINRQNVTPPRGVVPASTIPAK